MSDFNFEQASYSDLLVFAKDTDARCVKLLSDLSMAQQELSRTQVAFQNRDRQRDEVSEVVQELIDNGSITDADHLTILCKNLDVVAPSRTINFTVTVELTGSFELEYGEELDDYGFSVDGLTYNGQSVEFDEGHFDVEFDEE